MDHPSLLHWIWLLPLGFAALYIGSPRFLGTQANQRLNKLLKAGLDRRHFTLLQDLDLAVGGGVMHYDHLVLSRSGIHVIDALYLPGKIKGQRAQALWQRVRWGRKVRFDNPVHENYLRLQALQRALHLAPACFLPCVAISGYQTIETDAKDVVLDVARVVNKINSQARPLLAAEELNQALLQIQQMQVKPTLFGGKNLRWKLLRFLALLLFVGGLVSVYQHELQQLYSTAVKSSEPLDAATGLQRWEDSLICSYSVDTGRCACYTPRGDKAEITAARCQQLAERGSVLKQ
ncbi:MAG TPA: nuclease-related domain-containing protein [Xanthomonadales bacterium]|nr:nuclease-related domain-containing protein [Xanthomonadales bacterium]